MTSAKKNYDMPLTKKSINDKIKVVYSGKTPIIKNV